MLRVCSAHALAASVYFRGATPEGKGVWFDTGVQFALQFGSFPHCSAQGTVE